MDVTALKDKFKRGKKQDEEEEFEEEIEDSEIEAEDDLELSDDIVDDDLEDSADELTSELQLTEEEDGTNSDLDAGTASLSNLDELDATGDIDVTGLENQENELEEDEEEVEEEETSAQSPLDKILKQLPFLAKFIKKPSAAKSDEAQERTKTEVDADAVNQLQGKDKFLSMLAEKVPALRGVLNKLNKKKIEDLDEDLDDDSVAPIKYANNEEETPPKKKLKVIHIVIILGAVVFLLYDDIFPPEPEPVAPPIRKIQKTKPVVEETPPAVEVPPPINDTPSIEELAPIEDVAPDVDNNFNEPVVVEDTTTSSIPVEEDLFDEKPLDVPSSDTSSISLSEDNEIDEGSTSSQDSSTSFDDEDSVVVEETKPQIKKPRPPMGQIKLNQNSLDEVIEGVNPDITQSILEELEVKVQSDKSKEASALNIKPIDAPTYEIPGRGLIYNCKGKHWACIDSVSFSTCEKNYLWTSDQGRNIECYPVKIYDNEETCERFQQANIDNVAETNFCKN
jgi:hypothetical protein